jgi:hypothetical protein
MAALLNELHKIADESRRPGLSHKLVYLILREKV